VWRIDRLGRTCRGLVSLFEELRDFNCNLVSLKDGIDLSTASGRLMANLLAGIASFETELRSERIAAGIKAKRRRGEAWGNGRKKGEVIKTVPEVRQHILMMKRHKRPIAEIARVCKLARQTVYSVIAEEASKASAAKASAAETAKPSTTAKTEKKRRKG
jgi:DNA invertase Pin-like site-specific DNA recombinase